MATFNIEIVTPLEKVYKGEAEFVKLRTIVGDMGILAKHAPLVSELVMGEIQQDGLPLPRRNWAMAVIALGMTMAVLDGAIANVALPTIAGDLHVNPSSSIWVVNAFQLAMTISLPAFSSLGSAVFVIGLFLSRSLKTYGQAHSLRLGHYYAGHGPFDESR